MIDPVFALKTTSSLLVPTHTHSHVGKVPTVTPDYPTYEEAGETGGKVLWVVFTIMLLSTIAFTAMSFRVPTSKRLFHVLTTFITTFAAISYFAMATGDGVSLAHHVVKESHKHTPDTVEHVFRSVYWARYVDWSVTTPLLLMDLAFLAGMSGADILVAVVADEVMVLTGLFAAFGNSEGQKWGYYAIACFAYLVIVYQLVVGGRTAVSSKSGPTATLFASIGGFTLVLWTLYPVVWGIGDGARKWGVDAEIISYAILDVLAKPVFGFWLLFAHRSAPSIEGFWSHGLTAEGSVRLGDDDEGA